MRFTSNPVEEHREVPLADEGRLEDIVSHFTSRETQAPDKPGSNKCYVVCVSTRGTARDTDGAESGRLAEILGLVEAQGDQTVGHEICELVKPDPRTLVRKGVAERLGQAASEAGANLLVLDADLSPSQARNLEDATGLPICDREAVILNVFERHANTRRARIQVEIAHLEYLRPRIRGIGLNMDQQAGGIMGGRGPGETASELLARRLDRRLSDLKRALSTLKESDRVQRKHRDRAERVVLVGYTNAGKTSLMNALTSAELSSRDRPFETLETTSRCLTRHGGDVLLSDTVGFIRRLPERLFSSFESTLAELCEASLLLMVVDAADPESETHLDTTERVLERLGAERVPRFYAFNKIDRLAQPPSEPELCRMSRGHDFMSLSSRNPEQVARLKAAILHSVRRKQSRQKLFVPYEATELSAEVYAQLRVLKQTATATGMRFLVEGDAHVIERVRAAAQRSNS